MKKIYKIDEAAQECRIEERVILHFIHNEWIRPVKPLSNFPELDEEDVARARLIHELQEIFGVNDEAVPVILHLLDQLYAVRRHLNTRNREQA